MRYASMVFAAASVGIGLAGAASAKAATITEVFGFPPVVGYSSRPQDGSSFSAFNPALGTLESVTYNLNAIAQFTGGGPSDFNTAQYMFQFSGPGGGSIELAAASRFGNGFTDPVRVTPTVGPPLIATFFGPGSVVPSVFIVNSGHTPASIRSSFPLESVTYNYKPIPEPSTWAMMLLGFSGLGFLGYRQTRRAKPQAA
jgi:hypothetical protein